MRQTWEEVGIDLAERDFMCIGQLDDREITTSLGKRLLMILSPFVFLQLAPAPLSVDPLPGTTLHWVPLEALVGAVLPRMSADHKIAAGSWSSVTVDAASRLTPRHAALLKILVRLIIGNMQFPAILLDDTETRITGLTSPTIGDPQTSLDSHQKYSAPVQDTLEKGIPHKTVRRGQPSRLKLWGLSLGMTLDLMAYMVLFDHHFSHN